jgi:hypothetical protein
MPATAAIAFDESKGLSIERDHLITFERRRSQ